MLLSSGILKADVCLSLARTSNANLAHIIVLYGNIRDTIHQETDFVILFSGSIQSKLRNYCLAEFDFFYMFDFMCP
jgi:hypothetical protein